MHLPTAFDLRLRENLVPTDEIIDHLVPCLHAVEEYERKATVTVTYAVSFDQELQKLTVETSVKSKRPVKVDRNEERLGDGIVIFAAARVIPGQQRLPGTERDAALEQGKKLVADLRATNDKLEAQGASVTLETKDGHKVTIGKRKGVEKPAAKKAASKLKA